MRSILLPILLLPILLLTGCGEVDQARALEQVQTLEAKLAQLRAFIDHNAPVVVQLRAIADQTQDPILIDAADTVAKSVAAAQAALPGVQEAVETTKTELATVQANAAGTVPWWSVLAPGAIFLARLIPGVGPVVADLAWALLATRRQKAADLLPTTSKA